MVLRMDQRVMCDVQGRLFKLALRNSCDCQMYIEAFMNSRCAERIDDIFDRLQCSDKSYILEDLRDEVGGLKKSEIHFSRDVMY